MLLPNTTRTPPVLFRVPTLRTRPEWDATGESFWCVISKLQYLNDFKTNMMLDLFLSEPRQLLKGMSTAEKHQRLRLDIRGNAREDIVLANTNLTETTIDLCFGEAFDVRSHGSLRYCPACIAQGFHTMLFQHWSLERCPWHRLDLEHRCGHCKMSIPMRLFLSVKHAPFTCGMGHSLWPEIGDGPWLQGPSEHQRMALIAASDYIFEAADVLSTNSASPIASVGFGYPNPTGWTPLYQEVRMPPSILDRMSKQDARTGVKTVTSPAELEVRPDRANAVEQILIQDMYPETGTSRRLAETQSGKLFKRTAMAEMASICETFYRQLHAAIATHHEHCGIGLHFDRTFESWTVRDRDLCVWRAAAAINRQRTAIAFRDYGDAEINCRASSVRDTFRELFRIWFGVARVFLQAEDDNIATASNTEFCSWLAGIWLKDYLESQYIDNVKIILKHRNTDRRIQAGNPHSQSPHLDAMVDYSEANPAVTFESRALVFPRLLRLMEWTHCTSRIGKAVGISA